MFSLQSAKLRGARVNITVVDPLYALSNAELKQRALADLDAKWHPFGQPRLSPGIQTVTCCSATHPNQLEA